jgi:hypothetical protein
MVLQISFVFAGETEAMTDMIGGAVPRPLHTGAGATGPGAGAIPPDIVTATSSRPDCGGDLALTHKHTSPKQRAI